jgi:hypothetical protein
LMTTASDAQARSRGLGIALGIIAGAAIAGAYSHGARARPYYAPRRYVALPAAQPGVTRLYASKGWVVSHFARNDAGNQMCSMWHDTKGGGIGVKYNNGSMFVELNRSHWSLYKGQKVPMSVHFDDDEHASFTDDATTGIQSSWRLNSLYLTIPKDDVERFLGSFEDADTMTVYLPNGTEPPVRIGNMDGSRKASKWFQTCINKITG